MEPPASRPSSQPTSPDRSPTDAGAPAPWPAWLRAVLLALLVAVAGTGLVVLLYSRGILPIAGPFVALLVVPVIFLLRAGWLRASIQRRSRAAAEALQRVAGLIDQERTVPAAQRGSRALDSALDRAEVAVQDALRQLAADRRVDLSALTVAATGWTPGAPLTDATARALTALSDLERADRRARALAERSQRR